jgi:hypothetical protein
MNRVARIAILASLLALPLAACESFDPTDIFDNQVFNPKKKLPGDRRLVFPEGTPGIPQGVPQELVKGYQGTDGQVIQADAEISQAANPPEKPKAKAKPKPNPKPKLVEQPPQSRSTAVTVRPAGSPFPDPPPTGPSPATGPRQSVGAGQVAWPDPPVTGTASR